MPTLRRVLLLLAWLAVGTAIIAPLGVIGAALYSTAGLQFVVRHIPHRFGAVRPDSGGGGGSAAGGLASWLVGSTPQRGPLMFGGVMRSAAPSPPVCHTLSAL